MSDALFTQKSDKQYPTLVTITENGYGKSTYLAEYRKTKRGAGGVKTLNMTKKTGKPVISLILDGTEETLLVTTKNGVTIKMNTSDIPQLGRATQGVKLIRLDDGDEVVTGSVN